MGINLIFVNNFAYGKIKIIIADNSPLKIPKNVSSLKTKRTFTDSSFIFSIAWNSVISSCTIRLVILSKPVLIRS